MNILDGHIRLGNFNTAGDYMDYPRRTITRYMSNGDPAHIRDGHICLGKLDTAGDYLLGTICERTVRRGVEDENQAR